ncbi:MAG: PAS domain-containing sensor histidine kinase, partial [Campylobacterota bacterium]|nr:PAS domain-containing sensor histidine kinase [Campylobacterota bacterium]
FILLIIMIVFYFIYEYKLRFSNQELLKFKNAVEYSDNIVLITDNQENIKYVNKSFVKSTGYSKEEAIGNKPNILKSKELSKEFYKNMKETIYSGKIWRGEFINRNKYQQLRYEKASITPILNKYGEIEEFIAMKLDVTQDRINELKLVENERMLIQQSKMASMGEMIGNIAHQWRQPLSVISTIATGFQMKIELGMPIEEDEKIENLKKIEETIQYLSQTIDDFRDFFKPDKNKTTFNIKDVYKKTLKLVSSKLVSLDIVLVEDLEDIEINNLENELMQVIINILNNARDILETKKEQKRLIFINIYKDENDAVIEIKDNAGGIPDDIIDKVFEPYFTTKHKSNGTGIGLYMSHEMIFKHMNGMLFVENIEYDYKEVSYKGAKFSIKLPLKDL